MFTSTDKKLTVAQKREYQKWKVEKIFNEIDALK